MEDVKKSSGDFPIKCVSKNVEVKGYSTQLICQKFSGVVNVFISQINKPGMILVGERDSLSEENIGLEKDTFDIQIVFGKRKFDPDGEVLVEELIIRELCGYVGNVVMWINLKKEFVPILSKDRDVRGELMDNLKGLLKCL